MLTSDHITSMLSSGYFKSYAYNICFLYLLCCCVVQILFVRRQTQTTNAKQADTMSHPDEPAAANRTRANGGVVANVSISNSSDGRGGTSAAAVADDDDDNKVHSCSSC